MQTVADPAKNNRLEGKKKFFFQAAQILFVNFLRVTHFLKQSSILLEKKKTFFRIINDDVKNNPSFF